MLSLGEAIASGGYRLRSWTTSTRVRPHYAARARSANVSTVVIGVLVALAPVLPVTIRAAVLVLGLIAWAAAVALCAMSGLIDASRRIRDGVGSAILGVGAAGLCVALLAASQIEIIHTLLGRPGFSWSWRWDLNHAQAIARTGGLDQALDYSGVAIHYHVGPAWLAGAVQRVFGGGLEHVLWGVIPPLCVLSFAIAMLSAFRAAGVRYRYGLFGLGLALTVPLSSQTPWDVAWALPGAVVMPRSWPFLANQLMLNSLLALAIGGASLALLLDRSSRHVGTAMGAVGLASLMGTKPQYYAAFGLLVGLLGIARVLKKTAAGRDARVVIAAAVSLSLALAQRVLLPGDVQWFAAPVLRAAGTRGLFTEAFRASTLLAIAAMLAWRFAATRTADRARLPGLSILLGSLTTLFILSGILYFVDFPFRPDLIGRWFAIGFGTNTKALSGEADLGQALQVPRLMLLSTGFAVVMASAVQTGRWWTRGIIGIAAVGIASPIPVIALGFIRPPADYAVAEDVDLDRVLARIPTNGSLLIASDLADPAQHHRRPLQAMLLTAYRGHAFYVANLRYVNYAWPDAAERLGQLQSFFGTVWSPWHGAWLARTGVTHVLVHDRCVPPWTHDSASHLHSVGEVGRWTAFEVVPGVTPSGMPEQPPPTDLHPAYGIAACLSGRTFDDYRTVAGGQPEASGRANEARAVPLEAP
jgi:hypothetical protein